MIKAKSVIPFSKITAAELFKKVELNKKNLVMLVFGVEYLEPVKQSLLNAFEFCQKYDSESAIDLYLLNCEELDFVKHFMKARIVAGTPVMRFYFKGKEIKLRFKHPDDDHLTKSQFTNVYIGQLYEAMLSYIVGEIQERINQSIADEEIHVDLNLERITIGQYDSIDPVDQDESEEDDSETDTGDEDSSSTS